MYIWWLKNCSSESSFFHVFPTFSPHQTATKPKQKHSVFSFCFRLLFRMFWDHHFIFRSSLTWVVGRVLLPLRLQKKCGKTEEKQKIFQRGFIQQRKNIFRITKLFFLPFFSAIRSTSFFSCWLSPLPPLEWSHQNEVINLRHLKTCHTWRRNLCFEDGDDASLHLIEVKTSCVFRLLEWDGRVRK